MKTAKFTPRPAYFVDVKNVVRILKERKESTKR
jgi:hypothetical protein